MVEPTLELRREMMLFINHAPLIELDDIVVVMNDYAALIFLGTSQAHFQCETREISL